MLPPECYDLVNRAVFFARYNIGPMSSAEEPGESAMRIGVANKNMKIPGRREALLHEEKMATMGCRTFSEVLESHNPEIPGKAGLAGLCSRRFEPVLWERGREKN